MWSRGRYVVVLTQKYFNLVNNTFAIPPTTGHSYSFKSVSPTSGFWERLVYTYTAPTGRWR